MLEDLSRQLAELLDGVGELVVTVLPDALIVEDEVVLEATEADESLPFALYRDGIRRLEFLRGLPLQELEAFVEAMSFGLHFAGVGDDIVSLLWRKELGHISYVVIDTTIVESNGDSAPQDPLRTDPPIDAQINALLRNIYGTSEQGDAHLSLHLDGADLPAKLIADTLGEVDAMARGLQPLKHLDAAPSYRPGLDREIAEEGEFAISVRALEGALAAFTERIPPVEAQALADALLRMLDTALLEDRFQVATGIVQGVRRSGQSRPLIGDWMEEVVSEARFRHVASAFNSQHAGEDVRAAILDYFRACGAWAVNPLVALLPGISDAQLRGAVCYLLVDIGIVDLAPVQAMLHNEQAYVAQEAVNLLVSLDTPESHRAVVAAAQHPSPHVRLAVVELVGSLPRDLARGLVTELANDRDPKVRGLALRSLVRFPGHGALHIAEAAAQRAALEGQSFEYKRSALEAYATLAQHQAVQLLHRYIRDGEGFLAGKEAEELAVASTGALSRIRTVAAVEILKRTSGSRNKRLKETAKRALMSMKERP